MNQWIRTAEKLPTHDDDVLMFFHRTRSREVGCYGPQDGWRSNPWGMGEESFPSHWMPIAAAPSRDEVDYTFRADDKELRADMKGENGKYTLEALTAHYEGYDRNSRISLISDAPLSAAVVILCTSLIATAGDGAFRGRCSLCGSAEAAHAPGCAVPLALSIRRHAENGY